MEELIRNLEAAEDALETYRANARLSKISDPDAENKLIASVESAKGAIADYEARKEAFFAKVEHESKLMMQRHEQECRDFVVAYKLKAKELGYVD